MQDPQLLTLCWHSLSWCGRAHVSIHFDHWGSQYIENGLWRTDVNILGSTVTYLNATINVTPKMQNRRLKSTGQAKPCETRRSTGTDLGLTHQYSAGRVFGRVWNRTDLFFESKPGLLVGYPDPSPTLARRGLTYQKIRVSRNLSYSIVWLHLIWDVGSGRIMQEHDNLWEVWLCRRD